MIITEEAIKTVDSDRLIPRRKALYVDDQCINIVSNRYKVVQPTEVVKTFESVSGLTVTNQLTNRNTGGLFLSSTIETKALCGEDHKIDVVFYTGHNGMYKTFLSMQAMRIACFNQLPAIAGNEDLFLISEKHFYDFDFKKLKKTLEGLPLHLSNFQVQYEMLKDIKYTRDQFLKDFIKFFKVQEEQKDKVSEKVVDMYQFAQGQDVLTNDSAYKAFQAVTYHLTHNGREKVKNRLETVNIKNQAKAHTWLDNLVSLAA